MRAAQLVSYEKDFQVRQVDDPAITDPLERRRMSGRRTVGAGAAKEETMTARRHRSSRDRRHDGPGAAPRERPPAGQPARAAGGRQ